jgi:hypothetical protein
MNLISRVSPALAGSGFWLSSVVFMEAVEDDSAANALAEIMPKVNASAIANNSYLILKTSLLNSTDRRNRVSY